MAEDEIRTASKKIAKGAVGGGGVIAVAIFFFGKYEAMMEKTEEIRVRAAHLEAQVDSLQDNINHLRVSLHEILFGDD